MRLHLKQPLEGESSGLSSNWGVSSGHAVKRVARDPNTMAPRFFPLWKLLGFYGHPSGLQLAQSIRCNDIGEDDESIVVEKLHPTRVSQT